MKKWLKRSCLFSVVFVLLIVIGAYIEWQFTVNAGKNRLSKVRAALSVAEPGWQLDDLNDRRTAGLPPDEMNVAVIAMKTVDQFPKTFNEWERTLVNNPRSKLKKNQLADPKGVEEVRPYFEAIKPLIVRLHEIRNFPTGGVAFVFPDPDVLDFKLKCANKIRDAAGKLSWQVFFSTQGNDPNTAIEACRTGAHLRHAIGNEPTIMSQLSRFSVISYAIHSTERTLNMTEPKVGLAELQADFEKALQETDFIGGLEGERALEDRYSDNIANGSLTAGMISRTGATASGYLDSLHLMVMNRVLHDNHAQILETFNALRDAAKLKGIDRTNAFKAIPFPKTRTLTNVFVYLVSPSLEKVFEDAILTDAKLGTIVVAIACERYRQANGTWPEKLSDIPKSILKEIPVDPYVGGPVKYKREQNAIVVYTTGLDEVESGGFELDVTGSRPKTDVGIRLFDPSQRRLPPVAKPIDAIISPESMTKSAHD